MLPNFDTIWAWATLSLSPASVIMFLVAFVAVTAAWWFLKELREADLRLLEARGVQVEQLKKELKAEQNSRQELEKKVIRLEYEVKGYEALVRQLQQRVEQSDILIARLLKEVQDNGQHGDIS